MKGPDYRTALVLVGSATACSVATRDVRLFASVPDLPRAARSALREPELSAARPRPAVGVAALTSSISSG